MRESDLNRLPRKAVLSFIASSTTIPFLDAKSTEDEAVASTVGYGTDPVLNKNYQRGDFWPLILSKYQRSMIERLVDTILPADDFGPAASDLRVVDYIDEWVSAPYPKQVQHRELILDGLKILDRYTNNEFKKKFLNLSQAQVVQTCTELFLQRKKKSEVKDLKNFIYTIRDLSMGAYYATPEGWKAIGYVGNVPLARFDGPPKEVLDELGLKQTVNDTHH